MAGTRTRDAGVAAVEGADAVAFDGLWIFPLRESAVTTRAAIVAAAAGINLVLLGTLIAQGVILIIAEPGSLAPWSLLPLLVISACVIVAWRSEPISRLRYVVLTVIVLAAFAALTVAMAQSPAQAYAGTAGFVLSVSTSVAVIAGTIADRWTGGILGAFVGLVATKLVVVGTALLVGLPFRVDVPPFLLALGVVLSYALFPLARLRARGATDALAAADRRMRVRRARELEGRESIAHLHDTLLGTLAALAARHPGELGAAERAMIERGLESSAMLPALRGDPSDSLDVGEWIRSVGEAGGVRVVVDGDVEVLGALSPEVGGALRGALEQCVVNITRHAGVTEAWVSVSASETEVSVTVVDEGVGFDPGAIPSDRLGLSESVRGRIERLGGRVLLWSSPGAGTSVHISIPRES